MCTVAITGHSGFCEDISKVIAFRADSYERGRRYIRVIIRHRLKIKLNQIFIQIQLSGIDSGDEIALIIQLNIE